MKILSLLLSMLLVGCRTVAPTPALLPAAPAAVSPPPQVVTATAPPVLVLEQRVRQQGQIIEALISQNDALTAKLTASRSEPPPTAVVASVTPTVAAATAPSAEPASVPLAPPEAATVPNAEGLIDLAAVGATKPGEPVNPFAVRTVPPESVREIKLQVGGIIAGPVACAVINDRLVRAGDSIESFAVERIDSNAVVLRHDHRRLRLPVSGKPVRVRMPL